MGAAAEESRSSTSTMYIILAIAAIGAGTYIYTKRGKK